jgi:hypothetical protein
MASNPSISTGLFTSAVDNTISSKDLIQKKSSGKIATLPISPANSTGKKEEQQTINEESVSRIRVLFEKTIQLDELSIRGEKTKSNQRAEDSISLEFPLIKINNYTLNKTEISSVTIDSTNFLPTITLNVLFGNQEFLAREMPKDGDIISIAIRNRSDLLKIIRNDYVITGVHVLPNTTQRKSPVSMTFFGELFVPGLKSQKNDFSYVGTSFGALMDFAKRYGLGFATNEDDTDDRQIWLKANTTGDIYVNNVISRAWKDDSSFYSAWIDVYYNLNFVNVNKQLMSAESQVDIAVLLDNLDKNYTYGAKTGEEDTNLTVKVFSNFTQALNTSFYIKSWRPLNRSSAITFQIGTKMTCEMFEHTANVYINPDTSKYWDIPVEPTYDRDKAKKMMLLRGRATYVRDKDNPDLERANYPFVDLYEKFPWLGIQYTITNSNEDNKQWDGNHHKHYQLARVKNLINNKELDKLNLHIEVIGNNFNIIRGDKLPVGLIRTDVIENKKINPDNKIQEALDLLYSGWYYVKGFKLYWSSKNWGTIQSNFVQEFILTRREWPAPIPVGSVSEADELSTKEFK